MLAGTIQTSKTISIGLVVFLLLSINCVILNSTQIDSAEESGTFAISSDGPSFNVTMGNLSYDLIRTPGPMEIRIGIEVEVIDSDGVDTVIGSWANAQEWDNEELTWNNVTMSYSPREMYSDLYAAWILNYTWEVDDWGSIWYYKAYANDTLGHWSTSGVWFSVISVIDPPPSPYAWIAGLSFIVGSTAIFSVYASKRRS